MLLFLQEWFRFLFFPTHNGAPIWLPSLPIDFFFAISVAKYVGFSTWEPILAQYLTLKMYLCYCPCHINTWKQWAEHNQTPVFHWGGEWSVPVCWLTARQITLGIAGTQSPPCNSPTSNPNPHYAAIITICWRSLRIASRISFSFTPSLSQTYHRVAAITT